MTRIAVTANDHCGCLLVDPERLAVLRGFGIRKRLPCSFLSVTESNSSFLLLQTPDSKPPTTTFTIAMTTTYKASMHDP